MVRTGRALRRERMSARWLWRDGSRCWAMTMGAGKPGLMLASRVEMASMPPADEPTTTRWKVSVPSAMMPLLSGHARKRGGTAHQGIHRHAYSSIIRANSVARDVYCLLLAAGPIHADKIGRAHV